MRLCHRYKSQCLFLFCVFYIHIYVRWVIHFIFYIAVIIAFCVSFAFHTLAQRATAAKHATILSFIFMFCTHTHTHKVDCGRLPSCADSFAPANNTHSRASGLHTSNGDLELCRRTTSSMHALEIGQCNHVAAHATHVMNFVRNALDGRQLANISTRINQIWWMIGWSHSIYWLCLKQKCSA